MSAGPAEYAGLGEIYPGVQLKVILEVLNKFYNSLKKNLAILMIYFTK